MKRAASVLTFLCLLFTAAYGQGVAFPGPGLGGGHGVPIGNPTSFGTGGAATCTTTATLATTANIVAGNLAVIHVGLFTTNGVTVASVSDGTNTYTKANSSGLVASVAEDEIWYKANASAVSSGATITATFTGASGASCDFGIQTAQVSGVLTSSPLDQSPAGAATNPATSLTTTTATLAKSNEIAFGASSGWHGTGLSYTGPYGIDFWGDSITVGTAASPVSNGWATLLGPALGVPTTNHGVSGDEVPDMSAHVYSVTPATGSAHTIMIGTNDERVYCPNPCASPASATLQGYFKTGLEALAAYLATPTKHTGLAGGVTYVGTWTNTTVWALGKNSNTNGDTASFSVNGPVIYIGMIQQDSAPGTFTVSVDGTLQVNPVTSTTTFNTGTTGLGPTVNGVSFGAQLIRIPGLSAVSHPVIITVTSATAGASKVYLDWYASSGDQVTNGGASVLVSNILYAQAYTAGGSSANVDAFNAQVAAAVSELAGDGLRVSSVDNNTALNYSVDMDGAYHPINSGHAKIEAVWQAAIPTAPSVLFKTLGLQNAGNGTSAFDWRISRDAGAVKYVPTWATSGGMTALVATFKGN